MDYRLELISLPVSDVDRAKAFYVEQAGFNADHDHKVPDELRFVQLTPPGSACSIAFGTGTGEDARRAPPRASSSSSTTSRPRTRTCPGAGSRSATSRTSRGAVRVLPATRTATAGPCSRSRRA